MFVMPGGLGLGKREVEGVSHEGDVESVCGDVVGDFSISIEPFLIVVAALQWLDGLGLGNGRLIAREILPSIQIFCSTVSPSARRACSWSSSLMVLYLWLLLNAPALVWPRQLTLRPAFGRPAILRRRRDCVPRSLRRGSDALGRAQLRVECIQSWLSKSGPGG